MMSKNLDWVQNLHSPCRNGSANFELLQNPLLPRLRDQVRGVRWVYPHRFPYRIIYRVSGQTVLVIAVVHAARHAPHWKKRILATD